MVVAGQEREVAVGARQREHDVVAVRLDIADGRQHRLCGRLRVLAHVMPERGDDVVRPSSSCRCGTCMPLRSLKTHFLAPSETLEAFGEIRLDLALDVDFGEAVGEGAPADGAGHLVRIGRRIERVGGRAMAEADASANRPVWLRARAPWRTWLRQTATVTPAAMASWMNSRRFIRPVRLPFHPFQILFVRHKVLPY